MKRFTKMMNVITSEAGLIKAEVNVVFERRLRNKHNQTVSMICYNVNHSGNTILDFPLNNKLEIIINRSILPILFTLKKSNIDNLLKRIELELQRGKLPYSIFE